MKNCEYISMVEKTQKKLSEHARLLGTSEYFDVLFLDVRKTKMQSISSGIFHLQR